MSYAHKANNRKMSGRKKKLQQPPLSYADCANIPTEEDMGRDFDTLVNAPLSKGGHFVFKSEKEWSPIDYSKYSEFFTLDLNTLVDAFDSIPFNKYINVDDKYFTKDQLTSICNNAEEGKADYNRIFNATKTSNLSNAVSLENRTNENTKTEQIEKLETTTNAERHSEENLDNLGDDVDFLLSLSEPVQSNLPRITQSFSMSSTSMSHNNDLKPKSKTVPTKSIDLEKWLDSVLED